MRRLTIILWFFLFSLFFLLAISGCGPAAPGRVGDPGPNLIILQAALPERLDPAISSHFATALPLTGIYEGLVRFNQRTLAVEPCLAESWRVSDDGKRWIFQLKPGLLFSDGSPCDAEAVKAGLSRSMVLMESQPYCNLVFSPVAAIETDGPQTVTFVLKYPFAPFLRNLALPFASPVVSPGALGRYGDRFWEHPSGTGPYMLKEITANEIVLQPNPVYRDKQPFKGNLLFRAVPDPRERVKQLLDGRADIVFDPARQDLDRIALRDMKITSLPGLDVSYLGFFTDKPPFDNKLVRRAVAYALDRERIVAAALGGEGVPAAGLAPPPVLAGKSSGPPRYTPDQVRRILAREGYPGGIEATLITYRESRRYCPPGGIRLAEEIKRQLEPAGVRVTVQSRPWSEHKEAINSKAGNFFLYGWTGDNGDADNFLYTLLASSQAGQGLNASGFKNERLDVFLHTARRVSDQKSREYLYSQAESIILDEVPLSPLNHSLIRVASRPGVENLFMSGFGLIDLYALTRR